MQKMHSCATGASDFNGLRVGMRIAMLLGMQTRSNAMDQRARIPSIHRIKQSATENCLDVGYRYVDGLDGIPRVGDACECSNDWDENTELPGTCTFDNLDDCLEYARHSTGHLLVVTGSFVKYGAMSGEAILANATIQAVLSRTATDRDWE